MLPITPPMLSIKWLNILKNTKAHFVIFVYSFMTVSPEISTDFQKNGSDFEAASCGIALLGHFLADFA